VYTPKDFDLTQIMRDIVELVGESADPPAEVVGSANSVT